MAQIHSLMVKQNEDLMAQIYPVHRGCDWGTIPFCSLRSNIWRCQSGAAACVLSWAPDQILGQVQLMIIRSSESNHERMEKSHVTGDVVDDEMGFIHIYPMSPKMQNSFNPFPGCLEYREISTSDGGGMRRGLQVGRGDPSR